MNLRNITLTLVWAILFSGCHTRKQEAKTDRIETLIQQMTLEEKIGQMTQMCFSTITLNGNKDLDLNPDLFREAITRYHVGSFLSGSGSAEQWAGFVTQMQRIAVEETRLGIPLIIGIDHVHGANYVNEGTFLPHNLTLSCSFDTAWVRKAAQITAAETGVLGLNWNFAPVLDVGKNGYWPRLYETFGEDPLVCSLMGEAFIKAYQQPDAQKGFALAACAKHFIGYSDPVSGWDRTPALIPDQTLYEDFLPPFQRAVEAGVKTIMLNSGEVNGIPVHVSNRLLQGLLREELGYEGVVVTDIKDIAKVYEMHHGADSEKDAVFRSVNAGIDISMSCNTYHFSTMLKELVLEGSVPESRIDESVRRILTLKFDLGLFENPYPAKEVLSHMGKPGHDAMAFEMAASSMVLLKNQNQRLPLAAGSYRNILVTGPAAHSKRMLNGAWTLEWEGAEESRQPAHMKTLAQALEAEFPQSNILIYETSEQGEVDSESRLLEVMKGSDLIVLALGEKPYSEFKGNLSDLTLDACQIRLAELAQMAGKPVVLILVQGRPRLITAIEPIADAILFSGYPGQKGGEALAALMSGRKNPSGRLSFSYPLYAGHVIPYYHKPTDRAQNLYEFGHGLSYSDISYSDLLVSDTVFAAADHKLTISLKVTNRSAIPGEEAVLFYFTDHKGSITRPVKKLFYFEKIFLEGESSKTLQFEVEAGEVFGFPDHLNHKLLEPGLFTIQVGACRQQIRYRI